jgi:cyclophilin family peptidyl-prolyl cis-trans isomerase
MAAHKAATAVTIAPVQEKSLLAQWVERYWKLAALLAVVITGGIIYLQYRKNVERGEHDTSWDKLMAASQEDPFSRDLRGGATELQAVASQVQGKDAGPWALYLAATSAAAAQDYETAKQSLARLRQEYPAHPLVVERWKLPGSDTPKSLVEQADVRIDSQAAWKASHPTLFANPEPPADAPKVKLHTDKGDIVVALYPAEAPKHCENFLKLAREGYYSGTKFHRVIAGFMIQGGDPNTISGDVATWGQGGPEYKIAREESSLKHFPGVLAAAKKGNEIESSGSQFYITVAPAHHLDGKHVVFGKVVSGMDVVHAIETLPIAAGTSDRPETPVTVQSMEVVGG